VPAVAASDTAQSAGEVLLSQLRVPLVGADVIVQVASVVKSVTVPLYVPCATKYWVCCELVTFGFQAAEAEQPVSPPPDEFVRQIWKLVMTRYAVACAVALSPCAAAVNVAVPPGATPEIEAAPPVNEASQLDPTTKHTAPGVSLVHATPLVIMDLLLLGE
jgi:hypothetical protein